MKLFDDEGNLDLTAARAELNATGRMNPTADRAGRFDEIGCAALLDIAGSLSVIALEAAQAMDLGGILALEDSSEGEDAGTTSDDFFVVGDLVHLEGDTEPGEIVKLGITEGSVYADVAFGYGGQSRHWAKDLVRLVGDDAPEGVVENAVDLVDTAIELTEVAALPDELDPHAEAAEAFDEFDEDFEPAPEITALDKLDAKPAKKKGGRK